MLSLPQWKHIRKVTYKEPNENMSIWSLHMKNNIAEHMYAQPFLPSSTREETGIPQKVFHADKKNKIWGTP